MNVEICADKLEMGRRAAAAGAEQIHAAIADRGVAHVIVATGASQFEMLAELVQAPKIDWSKVIFFHLDEYVGMPITHAASFRRYLKERLVERLPQPPKAFYYIDAESDPAAECRRLGDLIKQHPIDVAFIGIGENAHLAFNDPPADFVTEEPYLVVTLDEACRRQQFGEGWFPTLDDVPKLALSMSIRQILKSNVIVCSVPDERKAAAVKAAIEGSITPQIPASILQQHPRATIYLDPPAASHLLKK
ncbi:glucosamine-6-phosphate deaminase [Anatilimnocola sp. NA78]|uniref:glucosamine-6-phosphate deaminase n=1 Tax=Anatilimnocola sp. NA78 TaxID=3415683 RepID=UPI003CE5066A